MAEYITIMIINNKTRGKFLSNSHAAYFNKLFPDQISSELEDRAFYFPHSIACFSLFSSSQVIGSVVGTLSSSLLLYALLTFLPERGFIDWLFAEAARGAPESELSAQSQTQPTDSQPSLPVASVREGPSDARRIPPSGPRGNAPLYQQAISQALPSQSPTAQKRTASGRSPSPSGQNPNKSRRTDLPSGPRAMRDARQSGPPGPRSLLERVGPRTTGSGFPRPDNMQNNIPGPGEMDIQAAIAAGFVPPGMNGMDMNALAAAQMAPNPLLLQEMMMNQMAMMAQMASSMGMMNPGQFGGFPMQPGAQDVGMFGGPGGYNGPPIGSVPNRGRVGGRGEYSGHGRCEAFSHLSIPEPFPSEEQPTPTQTVEAPAPISAPTVAPTPAPPQPIRPNYAVPERPQSPTLCKFSLKCTNPHCRWSHPSPVATPESGMVLSNEPCEQGKDCKDKDCVKAHISPAAVNPTLSMCLYLQSLSDSDFRSRAPTKYTKYAGSSVGASTSPS